MLRPLTMKHVRLQVLTEDLPRTSLVLARLGVFGPDPRPRYEKEFPHLPGVNYTVLHQQAMGRLEKIRKHVPLAAQPAIAEFREVPETELAAVNDWLGEVWERCSLFEEEMRRLGEEEHGIRQLEEALRNFAHLDIDLGLLQGGLQFLDLHIGMFPRGNIPQLHEALRLAGAMIFPFMEGEGKTHVIVVGQRGRREEELRGVLDTAGFTPLPIPPELHHAPDQVRRELREQHQRLEEERRRRIANRDGRLCGGDTVARLELARVTLLLAEPYVQLELAARSSGHLAMVRGWVPAREVERVERALTEALANPFLLVARDPHPEERPEVPSAMRRGWLMSPFATLVKQYGVPRYGEIDPTLLFTLSYVFMFGMMFGDIGHGLTIVAAGWLLRRKLGGFMPFVAANGLSATVFGFLYGSLFGFEEILHPLWLNPLSDPLYMLSVALGWGVLFLLLISLLNIHNRLVSGEFAEALFGSNGLTGLLLYGGMLWWAWGLQQGGPFNHWPAALCTLAVAMLMGHKLAELDAPAGERIMVASVETFETITGYFSNTLSFLRVAAFSLNHVALAIAVFTLANQMDVAGHWIMILFGNLFILVLEGAIVTIQALRLEYYEGFSRFFAGDGREFKPITLYGDPHLLASPAPLSAATAVAAAGQTSPPEIHVNP